MTVCVVCQEKGGWPEMMSSPSGKSKSGERMVLLNIHHTVLKDLVLCSVCCVKIYIYLTNVHFVKSQNAHLSNRKANSAF